MGSNDGQPCAFDASDGYTSPYSFYYDNGTQISEGVYQDGVCVFDNAACYVDKTPVAKNGSTFACCKLSGDMEHKVNQLWLIPFIGFMVPYYAITFWLRYKRRKAQSRRRGEMTGTQPPLGFSRSRAMLSGNAAGFNNDRTPEDASNSKASEHPLAIVLRNSGMSQRTMVVCMVLFIAAVAAQIAEFTILPKQIQTTLTPGQRSAELAMSSFLTPIEEIFAFLEDAMTIQVGYALATGNNRRVNALLNIAAWGGLFCGAIAFVLMVIVQASKTSATALLNPSAATNDVLISNGCKLVPTSTELLSQAKNYWLIVSASWVPSFISKGIFGFLVGTLQLPAFIFPAVVNSVVPIALWFGLKPLTLGQNPSITALTVVGIAGGTGQWLVLFGLFAYIWWNKALQRKHSLKLIMPFTGKHDFSNLLRQGETRAAIKDGLLLMVVDVCVQLSITITIYIAAHAGFENVYKLAAVNAAYWTWGPNYLMSSMFLLRLAGAQLVSKGYYASFANLCYFALFIACILLIAALYGGITHSRSLAFEFGESACKFGSHKACASTYRELFVTTDSLHNVFKAFGPVVAVQLIFMVTRASLAVSREFAFMAKAAVASFILAYVPAILVAHYKYGNALSYYIAMYVPHFALACIYAQRSVSNIQAMLAGKPGAWTENDAQAQASKNRKSSSEEHGLNMESEMSSSGRDDSDTSGVSGAVP
eukprot:g661.t1